MSVLEHRSHDYRIHLKHVGFERKEEAKNKDFKLYLVKC